MVAPAIRRAMRWPAHAQTCYGSECELPDALPFGLPIRLCPLTLSMRARPLLSDHCKLSDFY